MSVLSIKHDRAMKQLVLNRPERGNSLNSELVDELEQAISTACEDGTRTLILSGKGDSFCTGFDLANLERVSDDVVAERIISVERCFSRCTMLRF